MNFTFFLSFLIFSYLFSFLISLLIASFFWLKSHLLLTIPFDLHWNFLYWLLVLLCWLVVLFIHKKYERVSVTYQGGNFFYSFFSFLFLSLFFSFLFPPPYLRPSLFNVFFWNICIVKNFRGYFCLSVILLLPLLSSLFSSSSSFFFFFFLLLWRLFSSSPPPSLTLSLLCFYTLYLSLYSNRKRGKNRQTDADNPCVAGEAGSSTTATLLLNNVLATMIPTFVFIPSSALKVPLNQQNAKGNHPLSNIISSHLFVHHSSFKRNSCIFVDVCIVYLGFGRFHFGFESINNLSNVLITKSSDGTQVAAPMAATQMIFPASADSRGIVQIPQEWLTGGYVLFGSVSCLWDLIVSFNLILEPETSLYLRAITAYYRRLLLEKINQKAGRCAAPISTHRTTEWCKCNISDASKRDNSYSSNDSRGSNDDSNHSNNNNILLLDKTESQAFS